MSTFRKAFVIGAAMLALPALASAQTSRVEGMALQGDYIKDYTGIYTYTSGIVNVGNLVYGELGTTTTTPSTALVDRQVGAVLGNLFDGNFGTWGIFIREWTPALGQGDIFGQPNPGNLGFDPNTNTNEQFDIMWGRKFGTTSLGLRLNRSYFRLEDAPPGITTTLKFDVPGAIANGLTPGLARNVFGLGGGLGFEMNPNTNVELSLLYQSRDYESSITGGARLEEDNTSNWEVAGRAMYQWQPNVLVVPVVKFYSFDLSSKVTPPGGASATFDNSLTGWQAGVAGNWTIGTNDLFVLGATFAQNKVDQQEDVLGIAAAAAGLGIVGLGDTLTVTESLTPQVFAALETHVNNWLTLRFGANKGMFQKIKVEDQGRQRTVEANFADFNMNLGAGVKLGTLQLDAVLNNLFPQTLGGFFSNDPGGFISFPKVTATYAF
jgi:hypothetical protein